MLEDFFTKPLQASQKIVEHHTKLPDKKINAEHKSALGKEKRLHKHNDNKANSSTWRVHRTKTEYGEKTTQE